MIERRRVILERGVLVGLAGMARVARFAEQRQVGQSVLPRHRLQASQARRLAGVASSKRQQADQGKQDKDQAQRGR